MVGRAGVEGRGSEADERSATLEEVRMEIGQRIGSVGLRGINDPVYESLWGRDVRECERLEVKIQDRSRGSRLVGARLTPE